MAGAKTDRLGSARDSQGRGGWYALLSLFGRTELTGRQWGMSSWDPKFYRAQRARKTGTVPGLWNRKVRRALVIIMGARSKVKRAADAKLPSFVGCSCMQALKTSKLLEGSTAKSSAFWTW